MGKTKFKPMVFMIPIILLVIAIGASMISGASFGEGVTAVNDSLLSSFGWLYTFGVFAITVAVFVAFFSPLGKVKVGGRSAKPTVTKKTYFSIVLCSIIGTGMPIWGAAEIIAHYSAPPASEGIEAFSVAAAKFGMRAVLMDWTFAPYAVYILPAILMAFAFYNMKAPFSLGSMLAPLFGDRMKGKFGEIIDAICIFTLVCGLVTSLATGSEALLYGLGQLSGGAITKNAVTMSILVVLIAATFILSATTGLKKGITFFSNLNIYFYIFILIFVFVVGPTTLIMNLGVESVGSFIANFIPDILNMRALTGDNWAYWWPIFYFAVYLAWALISAVFIARISYGFTFRTMIIYSFILPCLFTGLWMIIFSTTSLHMEISGLGMAATYAENYAGVVIKLIQNLPFSVPIMLLFFAIVFVSFVTAADSCTNAIAGLCTVGLTTEETEPPVFLKVFWGCLLGIVALVGSLVLDLTGIKAICNVGGFPALVIEVFGLFALCKIMINPKKYDVFKEDYDEYGNPLPQLEDKE
ncbi:MAG: BCCT family transporter [Eubacteriales bacterium]|nr:BCCT family transporter [Eubacteriales bacterium]